MGRVVLPLKSFSASENQLHTSRTHQASSLATGCLSHGIGLSDVCCVCLVWAMGAVPLLGFLVWADHMNTVGTSLDQGLWLAQKLKMGLTGRGIPLGPHTCKHSYLSFTSPRVSCLVE